MTEESNPNSEKSSQQNGTIYLKGTHRTLYYNTDFFHKDDAFITVGMATDNDFTEATTCAPQNAVIGATIFNYDVRAPGTATVYIQFPRAVAFRLKKS